MIFNLTLKVFESNIMNKIKQAFLVVKSFISIRMSQFFHVIDWNFDKEIVDHC
jgi:hypothetical protein